MVQCDLKLKKGCSGNSTQAPLHEAIQGFSTLLSPVLSPKVEVREYLWISQGLLVDCLSEKVNFSAYPDY